MHTKRGFTLIEMLVVLAIIVFMVTAVLANTHGITLEARAKAAASTVLDLIKDTRNRSVAVKQFTTGTFPSYGLDFDLSRPQQVIVYADCIADDNADGIVDNKDTFNYISGGGSCTGGSLVSTNKLDTQTKIGAIRAVFPVSGGSIRTVSESRVDILFLRPEPTIWIWTATDGVLTAGHVEVDIEDTTGKYIRTVSLYSTGEASMK
ncbi:MAG TPA: type II secretion system protein [Candidatus Paceibacterota bacterium]|jgi:prepilin-type N-terminal cleavage/methylation domain-containing protein|nr:type II secretion system protein [Candidatus Paceibacterota bacterium]